MKNHQGCQGHHHDPQPALDRAFETLKGSGHKLTKPRQALLKAIASFDHPFSAEETHSELKKVLKAGAACDLVTVYRSLSTFSDLGILARVDLGDGVVRYELSDPSGSHHHHFVCKGCEKVEPLDLCEVDRQEQALRQKGYQQLSHRLEFFGLCPECAG